MVNNRPQLHWFDRKLLEMIMITGTFEVLANSKLRKSTCGHTRGLTNRGLKIRDLETSNVSWVNNYRTDVLDPQKGDFIRWDGRNVLCIVEGVQDYDQF